MRCNNIRWLATVLLSLPIAYGQGLTSHTLAQTVPPRGGPAGIYNFARIDPSSVIDAEFIAGHTARVGWKDLNPADGQYEFSQLDALIKELESIDQKLNLELLVIRAPDWLLNDPDVETFEHFNQGTQPLPWNPKAMEKWQEFLNAYATHEVELGESGQFVPFAEHPVLEMVSAPVMGLSSFRDIGRTNPSAAMVGHADYERQKFLDAARDNIRFSRDAFPEKSGFVGFFGMSDDEDPLFGGLSLEESILQMLDDNFDGAEGPLPSLGLFQELLSDTGPNPGSKIANAQQQLDTFLVFQALSAWTAPFNPDHIDNVTSMNPATGIELAYNNFGSTFFEIYAADIHNALAGFIDAEGNPILDDLIFWNNKLTGQAIPEPSGALTLIFGTVGLCSLRRIRSTQA